MKEVDRDLSLQSSLKEVRGNFTPEPLRSEAVSVKGEVLPSPLLPESPVRSENTSAVNSPQQNNNALNTLSNSPLHSSKKGTGSATLAKSNYFDHFHVYREELKRVNGEKEKVEKMLAQRNHELQRLKQHTLFLQTELNAFAISAQNLRQEAHRLSQNIEQKSKANLMLQDVQIELSRQIEQAEENRLQLVSEIQQKEESIKVLSKKLKEAECALAEQSRINESKEFESEVYHPPPQAKSFWSCLTCCFRGEEQVYYRI